MPKPENSFSNPTGEVGDIARTLIFAVSTAVAEAAGSARESLRGEKLEPQEDSLDLQILRALLHGTATSVTLRKKIAGASNAQLPAQAEFRSALDSLIAEGLIAKSKAGEREVFELTTEGENKVNFEPEAKASGDCNCRGKDGSISTLKAAQRLSSVVLDVTANGSAAQKSLAAEELERARKRLLQILADEQLD